MRPSVQQPISKDKNVMAWTIKYYLKNHYMTLRSKIKVPWRSLWYVTHHLMVMHPHTIKKQLFDLGVKVQQRSLRYATHRLIVMHPHTKYHWLISKETIIWPWGQSPTMVITVRDTPPYGHAHKNYLSIKFCWIYLNYLTLRSKVITVRNTPPGPYGHAPTYQLSLTYLERQKCYGLDKKMLFKKQLFDLEVKGQGPTKVITLRDTSALWSCTHIPNIIDLSGKTKKLWSGQASLRRSRRGRKNQTKTICLPSSKGET